tara:strand:- start:27853 stop:28929 length:1077 start_codon:yes stop_codon:yes gene_type:complete
MNQLQEIAEQVAKYNRKIEVDILSKKNQKKRYIKYQQLKDKNVINFENKLEEKFTNKLTLNQIKEFSMILNELLSVLVFPSMTEIIHSHKKICLLFTEYEVLNYDINEFDDMYEFLNTPLAHNVRVQEGIIKMNYEIIAEILSEFYNDNGLNILHLKNDQKEIQKQFEKDIESILTIILEKISELTIKDLFFIYQNKEEEEKYHNCLKKSYYSKYSNNMNNIKKLVDFITNKKEWEIYILFNKNKKEDRLILFNEKEMKKIEKDIGIDEAKKYLSLALSSFLFSHKNIYIYAGYIKHLNLNNKKTIIGHYDGILFINDSVKRRDEKKFKHLEIKENKHISKKDTIKRIDLLKKANIKQ